MTHEDEVAFIMGEIAERALNPLPLARELRRSILADLAAGDAEADLRVPVPAGRLARLRRIVVDVVEGTFRQQAGLNKTILGTTRQLEALSTVLEERYKRGWANVDQRLGGLHHAVDDARERASTAEALAGVVASMQVGLAELHEELTRAEGRIEHLSQELTRERRSRVADRTRVDALLDALTRGAAAGGEPVEAAIRAAVVSGFDDLYAAFEDEFRGSADEVRDLQRPYLDLLADSGDAALPVVDIGPGRGEWLELLDSAGIVGYGVDLNGQMVEIGAALGVDIRQGDALEHLAKLDEGSVRAITAFHFIEHISFEDQLAFLRASHRALCAGGAMVLETPNPTNLVVGASSFYLDPTHLRPVHPQLLEFLACSQGFEEVEVRYLHPNTAPPVGEAGSISSGLDEAVRWALFGPQDYALIARKAVVPAE